MTQQKKVLRHCTGVSMINDWESFPSQGYPHLGGLGISILSQVDLFLLNWVMIVIHRHLQGKEWLAVLDHFHWSLLIPLNGLVPGGTECSSSCFSATSTIQTGHTPVGYLNEPLHKHLYENSYQNIQWIDKRHSKVLQKQFAFSNRLWSRWTFPIKKHTLLEIRSVKIFSRLFFCIFSQLWSKMNVNLTNV